VLLTTVGQKSIMWIDCEQAYM